MTGPTYGDGSYGDPTPPEEPPVTEPYDFETFDKIRDLFVTNGQALWQGIDALVAEFRRLELRERTFAEDLMAEAEAHNDTRAERDTAVVRAEEAEEVAGAARAEIATLEQQRTDDRLTIADLTQRLHDCIERSRA